jgi:hypothetical protein
MSHIEIKTRQTIDSTLAQKIIDKGIVSAILTTGKITKPAQILFDEADIAWAQNIPESEFMESEAKEEG